MASEPVIKIVRLRPETDFDIPLPRYMTPQSAGMDICAAIDEDVLLATKAIAKQANLSMGEVLSALARQTLTRKLEADTRNGVPLFPRQSDAAVVTLELVNRLRDEIP